MKKENVPSSIVFPLHYPDLSIAIAILDWPSHPGEYRDTVILLKIATAWRQQRVLRENHQEQPDLTTCKPKLRTVEAHTLHDLGITDNLSLWISYRLVFFLSHDFICKTVNWANSKNADFQKILCCSTPISPAVLCSISLVPMHYSI